MKRNLISSILSILFLSSMVSAQVTIKGRVVDKTSQVPLEGAILRAFPSKVTTLTNSYGLFNFTTDRVPDSLVVTLLGYKPVSVAPLRSSENYEIELEPSLSLLNEVVVSTGYQQIAKERTTGSFSFMNEKMIERGVSGDIVSRMEDMVSGLQFDRRSITGDVGTLNLRVRGITTIEASSSPLIVLDNFPFEGSIENINPNDIESISFLKDASAASVWGAKAANGVIVLTSKKGKKNEAMKVHFSGIYTFKEKPDLYYSPDFLESSAYIEVEKKLFGLGFYNAKENQATRPVLSPVVEYLILARDNPTQSAQYMESIERLKTLDIRKDKEKYVYRPAQNQQYYLSLSGGSGLYRYFFSGGYDHELPDKIGVKKERITLKSNQTLDVKPWLSLHGNLMWITGDQTSDGGPNSYIDQYPYNRLKDENGENTEVYTNYRNTYIRQETAKGLLDWRYIPLDEIGLTPANTKTNDLRITTGLQVKITPDIVWDMTYNHLLATTDQTRFNKKESYYVRDLVNRFTQSDGTQRFPYNGLLYKSANRLSGGEFRTQINFRRIDKNRNEWGAMAGAEVRSVVTSSHSSQYFDYNEKLLTHSNLWDYITRFPVRPSGTSRIPQPSSSLNRLTDRFLSYYSNGSLTIDRKYTLTANLRWDASNLFGVKSNQKGVPLWSVGGAYHLSGENFYHLEWLPMLKIRSSYGYNGNVNNQASAFVTAFYSSDFITGLPKGEIRTPGNPQLRWEKVGTWNTGIDFVIKGNRVRGSVEYYIKKATDLLGEQVPDPTNGFRVRGLASNIVNYANMKAQGWDAEIHMLLSDRKVKWNNSFIFGATSNRVTRYNFAELTASNIRSQIALNRSGFIVLEGESLDALYYLPWYGLDEKGDPLVMLKEGLSTNYTAFMSQLNMDYLGKDRSTVPLLYGAVRNDFSWRAISLSVNVSWKAAYSFIRSSLSYGRLINNGVGHKDYLQRWQNAGDELHTSVPSFPDLSSSNWTTRDFAYNSSSVLVERGDHVRLRDVRLSYNIGSGNRKSSGEVFVYLQNPGFIWRANKHRLDPDIPNETVPVSTTLSGGFRINFK